MKRYVRELANDIQRYIRDSELLNEEQKEEFRREIEYTYNIYTYGFATEFNVVNHMMRNWELVKDSEH